MSDVVGLLDRRPAGVVAVLARLLGLRAEAADGRGPARAIDRAVAERWRLLHACPEDLAGLSEAAGRAVATFVRAGGTLYVDAVGPGSGGRLAELCGWLGVKAPRVMHAADARSLAFVADEVALVRELAGARLRAGCSWPTLVPASGWRPAVSAETARGPLPVVLRHGLGRGAVLLSTGPAALRSRLAAAFTAGSARAAVAVVPLLVLRSVHGAAAWHAPAVLANCSIDDPALRRGPFELAWDALLDRAREHGFHATIATIPRELPVADPAVVDLLRRHPARLSACYHGCDHDGYEFYAPAATRTRYPARPLAAQREALRRAVAHGRRFTEATGGRLDRVMVFPHGVGPAEILPELHRLGFIGSANFGDKYPPGGPVPDDADLGLRPADVAWSGFPLLWRRALDDEGFAIDVLLGRPALVFAHAGDLGRDFARLAESAAAIDRAAGGAAAWCGLEEVARHAYLQRRGPGGWEVLMTANEACLHNPDPAPRRVAVHRPNRPPESAFEVDGRPAPGEPVVVVPAGGRVVVRLVPGGAPALAGGRNCSLFATEEAYL